MIQAITMIFGTMTHSPTLNLITCWNFEFLKIQDGVKPFCSVLFLRHPRSEGWPHHGRSFSIYLYPLCHSDWLFHSKSCPRLDAVYPGRAWFSSPACTWHCSLHYFFLQAIPLSPHGMSIVWRTAAILQKKNPLNCHNSATVQHIDRQFGIMTHFNPLKSTHDQHY